MIRHEDNFPVLILYHEVLEVLPSSFTLKVAETQERLVHVVRIRHIDLRVKNDKDGAPVTAGKRHLKLFSI